MNGEGGTLEERLAVAQGERGTPNLMRQLAFIGADDGEHLELQVLGVHRRPGDSFPVTRAVHASRANAARLLADAERWTAQGAYIITGRLRPGVETRHAKPGCWFDVPKRGGTTDSDVESRRILPIDFDVARVAATSATDAEMALAIPPALRCWEFLADMVGEDSLAYLHSGNGRQIHVALDAIASSDEVTKLVSSILHGLAAIFSTEAVKIDVALSDPKRLVPACGTTKKKGAPGITERPHRRTAIVTPAEVRRVDLVQLRALHTRIRQDCDDAGRRSMDEAMGIKPAPKTATPRAERPADDSPWSKANALDPVAVAEWLDLYDAGELRCPGCGESAGVDVIDHGLKCLHDRCADKGRGGFRTNIDLVAEVRHVEPREAYALLAERFGLEPLADRKPVGVQNGAHTPEEPPAWLDEEPPLEEAKAAEPPKVWTPGDVIEQWRGEGPLVHEATGLEALDKLTGGGPVFGSRWYLVGAPDAGKTALLVQVADVLARRGIAVGLLAIDEEPADATMRLAQRAGFSREECEERNGDTLREIAEALGGLPFRLYGPEHTIESAAADLDAFARSRGSRAMLGVDSIQTATCAAVHVASAGSKDLSARELVTANVRAVRDVATRYRLIAIATSEMNRGAYRSLDAAETSNDLASAKESGAVEYSARVLAALRSVKGEPDLVELRLAKNKHGPAWREAGDSVFLRLDRRRMRLEPGEAPERPDPAETRSARGKDSVLADAATVVDVVAARPGIGVVELRTTMKAAHGSFSKDRVGVALQKLGRGIVAIDGARGAKCLHVSGAEVPADVLSKLPLERRAEVSKLTPPDGVTR